MKVRFLKRSFPSATQPVAFSIMRDETYFLPFFLQHYRKLGIEHFLIYADRCSESFLASLLREPDVAVMIGNASYGDNFGSQPSGRPKRLTQFLKETIPDSYLPDRWVLTVDADEFLILPPPLQHIGELIQILESRKQYFSFAPMVDFYPAKLSDRNYDLSLSPFAANRFFDRGPYHEIDPQTGRLRMHLAGIRARLLLHFQKKDPVAIAAIYGNVPVAPAFNFKYPLLKAGRGITRIGDHRIGQRNSTTLATCLAHFKFYPGLDSKITTALAEGQYYGGSVEYRFLQLAISRLSNANIVGAATVEFTGAESLVEAELMELCPAM